MKLLVSVLLVMMLASCAGQTLKFNTVSGSKIKVLEWGFFDQFCQPGDFTIKITQQPEFGELERGAGKMTIGRKSTDGARLACEGRTVASKLVNYIPNEEIKGTDKMRFSAFGQSLPPRLVTVEVTVR